MDRSIDKAWQKIFDTYQLDNYQFLTAPFRITAEQIKEATKNLKTTGEREVRIICKQDTREDRPQVFKDKGLFILPIRNGEYKIIHGEGYVDIPIIQEESEVYTSKLNFSLDTSKVGNSEMQHLDFAYASSLIRSFLEDDTLVLTIRGRKYTPRFSFNVGQHNIQVESVQTEVDAGYEGKNQVVLIEAKASSQTNTIIRQLYYPYRQWKSYTQKNVMTVFFEKIDDTYSLWQFCFEKEDDYNSIQLIRAKRFKIKE